MVLWAALGFTLIANVNLAVVIVLAYRERKSLIAAMLQSNGKGDAARRVATSPKTRSEVQQAVELQKEIMESGGVFSGSNPFGNKKPLGL